MTQADPWTARIDWPKVLDDIAYLLGDPMASNPNLRIAVSQEKLAADLEVPRGTLRGWIEGSEPRHSDGEALLARWCTLTGKARTFVHVNRYVYSAHKVGTASQRPQPRRTAVETVDCLSDDGRQPAGTRFSR